jgi:hypothetical protein
VIILSRVDQEVEILRRLAVLLSLLLSIPISAPAGASAAPAADAPVPPPGASANVELVGNVGDLPFEHPESLRNATAINFLRYGRRDVMFVVGRFGLRAYDLADPTRPRLLDSVGNAELALPGDATGTYWQNEDMNVDQRRKLVFLARDPRSFDGTTGSDTSVSGIYVIDARHPDDLELLTFHQLPSGHTSTCVNDCKFLWTGGPAPTQRQRAELGWTGRPIFVTDLRDPRHPFTYPDPVDTGRDDGTTSYSHDVQVDAAGVAWVSGNGGVRGYWTSGLRFDPVERRLRIATPVRPVPYAGGGFDESTPPARTASRFMHNAERPVGGAAGDGADLRRGTKPGTLLYATEEDFRADCATDGAFLIASLDGSFGGEAWRSTPDNRFRLRTVGRWSVADAEGVGPSTSCSAHYFQLDGGIAAYSWYEQGTRFLDVRDPANPIQIAYWRPDVTASWAPYWHRGFVYVADHERGVDILRLTGGAARASAERREVLAPRRAAQAAPAVREAAYRPDGSFGWACRVSLGR